MQNKKIMYRTRNRVLFLCLNENVAKDNQGRQLSRGQQEYFKDSKVRDENGQLKEVYHGTPYNFTQFNYDKLGENTSSFRADFYFIDAKETAGEYKRDGGNIKKVYLDIKKPLKYKKTTMSKGGYKKFINAINKETIQTVVVEYIGDIIEDALFNFLIISMIFTF